LALREVANAFIPIGAERSSPSRKRRKRNRTVWEHGQVPCGHETGKHNSRPHVGRHRACAIEARSSKAASWSGRRPCQDEVRTRRTVLTTVAHGLSDRLDLLVRSSRIPLVGGAVSSHSLPSTRRT
jgi:hypothetical protein